MNILLTNDDGIFAPGIHALFKTLSRLGKVTVVAPDSEKSSVGHGITLAQPIWYKKVSKNGKFFGYGISGTPADCVKFAVNKLLKTRPNFVVSGINLGPNEGCSVHYSGTVAGAREGAILGIPSLAVSLATFVKPDFSYAAKCGAFITKLIGSKGMPKGTFLNVNVPAKKESQIKGIKITRQGTEPIHATFIKRSHPNLKEYYWMSGKLPLHKKNNDIDTYALNNHYVTVTPVQCDLTHTEFLTTLRSYSKKFE